jgi:formylglycine-generating enzyme required for sulfatase activity
MHARPTFRRCLPVLASGLCLLVAGCAKQDLYETPGAPYSVVGRVPLPSQNEDVDTIGRLAFVAGGQAGLHAIDFTDPAHPVLLQTINTVKYSESVGVVRTFSEGQVRDIALVVEGTEGVTTYDVTDPTAMTSFNSSTTAVFGNRVFIDQPEDPAQPFIAYLAESWKGVRVFRSLPAQPGILAYDGVFSGTNGYAEGVVVRDGWCYVADNEMGLAVIDARILALGTMQVVSWTDSPGEALDIEIDGDYAFVADGPRGLAVYAIDGGAAPVHVGQVALEGTCRAIAVQDGLAVLAAQGSGLHFVDISNPRAPVFLGRVVTSYAMDICFSNEGMLLAVDRDEGMLVLISGRVFHDVTAPGPVLSLVAEPFGAGAVRLSWRDTGDDRWEGRAASAEVRHAAAAITDEAAWLAATPVAGVPVPGEPGDAASLVVENLAAGTALHFAVRVRDEAGNLSSLSNDVSAQPGEGILLQDPQLDRQAGTGATLFTWTVTYIFDEAPTVHEVVIDGVAHAMTAVTGKAVATQYRYQALMPAGEHAWYFRFAVADPEVPVAQTQPAVGPVVGRRVFTMGSPVTETGRSADEWQHTVVLSDSIVCRTLEVSQAEFAARGLGAPSHFAGADLPVETIGWLQAVAWCNAQSTTDGLTPAYTVSGSSVTWNREANGWRLPTEAEWEMLARAGTTTAFVAGDLTERVCNVDPALVPAAWYCGSFAVGETHGTRTVGVKQADPRGAFDMAGNVAEWCWDWYGDYRVLDADGDGVVLDPAGPATGTQRVVRGGSWYGGSEDCRGAARSSRYPESADDTVGLRAVRTVFTD